VIIHKLRPTALEVLFASTIIPDLHLVGGSSPECSRRIASRNSRPSMNLVNFSGRR
jgi:hypothetical protein